MPLLSYHGIKWRNLLFCQSIEQSPAREGSLNLTTIMEVVILVFSVTILYHIILCPRHITQAKKCHTIHSLKQNVSYISSGSSQSAELEL